MATGSSFTVGVFFFYIHKLMLMFGRVSSSWHALPERSSFGFWCYWLVIYLHMSSMFQRRYGSTFWRSSEIQRSHHRTNAISWSPGSQHAECLPWNHCHRWQDRRGQGYENHWRVTLEWLCSGFSFFDRSSEFHSAGRVCFERKKKALLGMITYRLPRYFWRWFSCSKCGICDRSLKSRAQGFSLTILSICSRRWANKPLVTGWRPTVWGPMAVQLLWMTHIQHHCCVDIAGGTFIMASDSLIE